MGKKYPEECKECQREQYPLHCIHLAKRTNDDSVMNDKEGHRSMSGDY